MKYSLYLGSISGIRISVHWTFLILIIWIVLSNLQSGQTPGEILWSIAFVLTIFACVTLHELGHALAAKRYRIRTRDITILPIGGVAQLESIPEKPQEELVVALAGPLVNVIIAGVLYPFIRLPDDVSAMADFTTIQPGNFVPALMTVNLWLALFNLIPAFPMDGGRVLRALLGFRLSHEKATRIAATVGQVLAIGFVFVGFVSNPFLIFIGFFIFLGAQSEAVYSKSKFMLQGHTVNEVVMREVPVIDERATVREAAAKLLDGQNRNFVVTRNGQPVGTLSRDAIIRALTEKGENVEVAAINDPDLVVLSPAMPLQDVWVQMRTNRKPLMLVMSDGQLLGVVDEENIAEFMMIRAAAAKQERG